MAFFCVLAQSQLHTRRNMATVVVPDSTVTRVLTRQRDCKAVWFQNFSTTAGFYLKAVQWQPGTAAPSFTTAEWFLKPGNSATDPGFLILDTPGLVNYDWFAYQASGGSLNLNAGQEFGGVPGDTGVVGP